jgi:hypothetical protein
MDEEKLTGSITIKWGSLYYTLRFGHHGWLAGELVQYLDDVIQAEDQQVAILKLLGYTMEIAHDPPVRQANHWVEIQLEEKTLSTNSAFLIKAVDQVPPGPDDPFSAAALQRVHEVLDRHDFEVILYPS